MIGIRRSHSGDLGEKKISPRLLTGKEHQEAGR